MKHTESNKILPGFIGKKSNYENCGEILTEEQKKAFESIKITFQGEEFKYKNKE